MKLPFSNLSHFRRNNMGGINPERDWLVLLGAALFLLLIIIGWNVWAFETVVQGGTLGNMQANAPATTTISALDTVSGVLERRASEDASYINGVYRFADPSQ